MARRSRRSADPSEVANSLEELLSSPEMQPLAPLSPFSLPLLEDNRTFHPEGPNRDPLSFFGTTEIDVYDKTSPNQRPKAPRYRVGRLREGRRPYGRATQDRSALPSQIGFSHPNRVAVCVRRKRRKEVLHALRKTGGGGGRRRRRNTNSQVRC